MIESAWNTVFSSLKYLGIAVICLYYVMPDIVKFKTDDGQPTYLVFFTIMYAFAWVILLLVYYFFNKKTNATVEKLWSVQPERVGPGSVLGSSKMEHKRGKYELLDEADTMEFLAETFTFSFFISVDNASIENVKGDKLDANNRLFQKLLVIPGAFNVEIDPLHENMRLLFKTYNTQDYEVSIPTLKIRRWHQILVSIEGRTADIYQNGILLKSVALPNVISARPGKPYVFMNSDMFARLAFVQSYNRRLKEQEVIENYRLNSDDQGIPHYPKPSELNVFGIGIPRFCVGIYCFGSQRPKGTGLTTVNYEYS